MSRTRTSEKKAAFLAALRERGSVMHAAESAGIGRRTAYDWRDADPEFAAAWEDALEDSTERLEESMFERAMKGDTTAAIFLLKGRRPEVYRERMQFEHQGRVGLEIIVDGMAPEGDG